MTFKLFSRRDDVPAEQQAQGPLPSLRAEAEAAAQRLLGRHFIVATADTLPAAMVLDEVYRHCTALSLIVSDDERKERAELAHIAKTESARVKGHPLHGGGISFAAWLEERRAA
jgi:hypothetical protein